MKNIVLFFLLALSIASCKPKMRSDGTLSKLKGNVKQLTMTEWGAVEKFGEVQKTTMNEKSIFDYNKDGFVTRQENTVKSDYYNSHIVVTKIFDADGRPSGYDGLSGKTDRFSGKFKYDDTHEQPIEEAHYSNGKMTNRGKLDYSDKGSISAFTNYDKTGKIIMKNIFKHNDKDLVTETITYDSTGNVDYTHLYTYDAQDRLISDKLTGKYPATYTYKYPRIDDKGNWLTQITYSDGKLHTITERKILYY